jgi:hypothetical protein
MSVCLGTTGRGKTGGPDECLLRHHWKREEGKTEMKENCCSGREEPGKVWWMNSEEMFLGTRKCQ